MSNLIHLIYASSETIHFDRDYIIDLLETSQKNNKYLNVTGMLLYEEGSFFQVLEGEEEVVNRLFETISKDPRHTNIVKIISETIAKRNFANWSMGYAILSKEELESIEGMNDFFENATCLTDISAGRAKKLLNAFSKGRWRLQ